MERYIDADKAMEEIERIGGHNLCDWSTLGVKALIDRQPTADVVPKTEYDALVEENESLEIELENMRRNLGDAREGWNDAECKVEELKAIIADHVACEERLEELYSNAKADVAREIFEEIEYLIWQNDTHPASELREGIAKLKKKYTEGERDK